MKNMLRTLPLLALTFTAAACGSSNSPADSGSPDVVADTAANDVANPPADGGSDGGEQLDANNPMDATSGDDGATLDAALDASDDAPPAVDVTPVDAAGCDYVDVDDVVVKCGMDYRFIGRFTDSNGAANCPDVFSADGTTFYATRAEAIASTGCSTDCLWHFAVAVDRLYCGQRTGYETLEAPNCPTIYRFPEGYFSSVEEHDTKYPCDDAGVGDGG